MERFSETGNVLLRYSVSQNEASSSTFDQQPTPEKDSDDNVDFNDVFGGPPRRFSMPEKRYSLGGGRIDAGAVDSSKPVFGGESYSSQRRYATDDFYDDIFMKKSNDSYGSPRWSSPTPGSRTLSPANSINEPLSSSVPAQFSLPAKLAKATDLPTFGSSSSPHRSPKTSLTRFSTQEPDDLSNNFSQSPDQTLLSPQIRAKKVSPSSEFHFSIHKWADRGVPLLMSLRGGKYPTLKGSSKVSSLSTASLLDVVFLNEVNEPEVKPLHSVRSDEAKNIIKEVNKSAVGSPKSSGENLAKSGVKGKVKQFVKIFSPEGSPKTKMNAVAQSLSSRWKSSKIDNEVGDSMSNFDSKLEPKMADASRMTKLEPKMAADNAKRMPDASRTTELENEMAADNVKMMSDASKATALDPKMAAKNVKKMPDASVMEEPIKKQQFSQNRTIKKVGDIPFAQMDASSFSESVPHDSKVTAENIDERYLENFQVQELSPDGDEVLKTDEDSEALRASDSKIRLWSNGRKGNIRSLLSTLQYVLWPESGWKPVALVDIIEANAVKRAYNRAMLCLHPDKLQQKGAAFHQKYMAEKIFDILQEAWDQFNSLGTLM